MSTPQDKQQERLLSLLLKLPAHEPMGVKLLRRMSPPDPDEIFGSGPVTRENFAAASKQAMAERQTVSKIVSAVRELPSVTATYRLDDFA